MSVLITGGTGFFGRAYVRAALKAGAGRVCVYSRGEHAQADMRASYGDDERLRWFIGDVRDLERLKWAMQGVRVVVHAAALKRIEVCEYNPLEVYKTNAAGAVNVIEAAMFNVSVLKVLAISTDKAWNPINIYGASKLLAEKLFLAANNTRDTRPRFAVCRYGNIAGSVGSVIPKWREMVNVHEANPPRHRAMPRVPVTDPECTRFWMTISEAVSLVQRTISNMEGGELAIPDLPAYRLGDLAEAMCVDMDIIGLPEYEKLHEGMADGKTSEDARRMTVDELRKELVDLP